MLIKFYVLAAQLVPYENKNKIVCIPVVVAVSLFMWLPFCVLSLPKTALFCYHAYLNIGISCFRLYLLSHLLIR